MNIIELIGRLFLSLIFLLEGVNKIFNYEETIEYMEFFNVPGYLLTPAIIIEILFPLLVIIGYKTKLAAVILSFFSILLAIIFHSNFSDQMQLISFLKNFAIAGGFIIIFVYGPNKLSLDYFLNAKKNEFY